MKRENRKIKDLKVGDVILLDVTHMDEQPHKIIEINKATNLFEKNSTDVSFLLELPNRERYHTCSFGLESHVGVVC